MERLTFLNGDDYFCVSGNHCFDDQNEDYCGLAIEKLASYENTGLSPNEVEHYKRVVREYAEACNGISLIRLNELVEAYREGRVKIYPCKVGDTVYAQNFIGGNDVLELFVEKVSADKEKVRTTTKANGIGMYAEYDWKMFREKTYKTRESAEKALEVQYGTD